MRTRHTHGVVYTPGFPGSFPSYIIPPNTARIQYYKGPRNMCLPNVYALFGVG